jgi:Zn-dependent peptidase ImmA (M78 family)
MLTTDSKSYNVARNLAYEKRELYSVDGKNLNLTKIRQIYKDEGISLVYRTGLKNLKALYMSDEHGVDVLCNQKLPNEPKLFALVHELKHHFLDRDLLCTPCCMNYDQEPLIEKNC